MTLNTDQLFDRALVAKRDGRLADTESDYQSVLTLEPNHLSALLNLGNLFSASGRFLEAEALQRRAVLLAPDNALAQNNLAATLIYLDQLDQAEPHLRQAIALDPSFAEPLGNIGLLYTRIGRLADAERAVAEARARAQHESRFAFQQAQLALLHGRYDEAWPLYEARRADGRYPEPTAPNCRRWQGEPLDGKRIILAREQGLGDQLQFLRYVPLLAERGAIVDVWVAASLGPLAETVHGIHRCLVEPPDASQYDLWAPLPSLAGLLGTRLDSVPAAVPYLFADPARVAAWRERLSGPCSKAGLVWAGSPAHPDNRFRTAPLQSLRVLAEVTGWQFYSLQKGTAAEAELAGWPLPALGPYLHDFAETAAAITGLDLVITVDTSVAHLAGALGKPVWLLLDAAPDWRWLLDRADSPWYPTARLFRQSSRGDWQGVAQAVAAALKTFVVQRKAPMQPTAGLARTAVHPPV